MMFISAGWESLLLFVKNSILNGSKEVALAAINCLQTTVLSHSAKVVAKFCEIDCKTTSLLDIKLKLKCAVGKAFVKYCSSTEKIVLCRETYQCLTLHQY